MAHIEQHPRGWRAHVKVSGRRGSRLFKTPEAAQQWAERQELKLRNQKTDDGRYERRRTNVALHVYIMVAEGRVKIGITGNPDDRWRKIGVGNPGLSPLMYLTPRTAFAEWIERESHRRLQAYSVGGEWFNCDISVAVATIKELWR
jgi:hypothetical protein